VIACGAQARPQAEALAAAVPFARGLAWDIDAGKARGFVDAASRALGIPFAPTPSLREATRAADVIVTCTTARAPIVGPDDVRPGAFIAAVGADNADKNEIAPALMALAKVVTDVTDQCLVMGDLHHAVRAGAMTHAQVHAELSDIVSGMKPGRTGDAEIIVFDSTGTAVQDVASAVVIFERARDAGHGIPFSFASAP
jgi:ornithine cyclodeaminase/alanine dehydrogenase-like protein (mu-crystallin family)